MCEVSRTNFELLFPNLMSSLAAADVVGLDMEFSGLDLEPISLFDDAPSRYAKYRNSVQRTTVLQVGLALFCSSPASKRQNSYSVRAFNFLLFPSDFPPLDLSFVCQSSALEFLTSHNFDLNACVERGISFLNDVEIARARRHLSNLERCDFLRSDIEREVRARSREAADWLAGKRENARLSSVKGLHSALLEVELRFRFPELWTSSVGAQGEISLFRVSPEERSKLEAKEKNVSPGSTRNAFCMDLMGFTRVIRTIVNLKKPIVAHNCFTDVLMLYEKFLRPLPADLSTFKAELHRLLPDIFDTRHIVHEMRKTFSDLGLVLGDAGSLQEIFSALKDEVTINQELNQSLPPYFEMASDCAHYGNGSYPHEAAFDAMMTGCVLLLLGHRAAFPPCVKRALVRPGEVNFEAYRAAMTPFANRLNVIQASFDWLDLTGNNDGAGSKPCSLVITARDGKVVLEDLKCLADSFGRNDVRPFGTGALVQFNSFGGFRALQRELRDGSDLRAEEFSWLRHTPLLRQSLLAAAIGATVISAAALVSLAVESAVRTAVDVVKPM